MAIIPSLSPRLQFAKAVRERFVTEAGKAMVEISAAVHERITALMDEPCNARESQARRDTWMAYKRCRPLWLDGTLQTWRERLTPPADKTQIKAPKDSTPNLELVGTEVVENKILASRMVMAIMEKVASQLDDLRLRMQYLEGTDELDGLDVLRPEVLVLLMVEQWALSGMPGDSWPLVNDVVQKRLIERLLTAYANANDVLIKKGVLPTIELKDRVKAKARGATPYNRSSPRPQAESTPQTSNAPPVSQSGDAVTSTRGSSSAPFGRQSSGEHSGPGQSYGVSDETRMMTSNTPLARARSRAQGVIGQIRRMFVSHGGGDLSNTVQQVPSPALATALAQARPAQGFDNAYAGTVYQDYSPAGVARVASDLREKTTELKQKAETKGEKATIEIVALMFQAILSEERIPPGIRVWFARLQMPVLRVALEDSSFLGTTTHPARLLIDRMGSCVMGFDSAGVQGSAMEMEIKRIVQVIEQYPETGKKVYQIVFDEFQKFLGKFLTETGPAQKVMGVAQQVEQKETLTIQYTIEMRNMLRDMPVRDEIRDFLFHVWAEVLAVAAVRKGPHHADTATLKKSATDLVWAASAKPNRADRARVIQELPNLLLRLRSGMTLLAMLPTEQERHVKAISDTLADAFLSKTQAIPQAKIDAMAECLSSLEDFVSEDGVGDLPLDGESIEMMLGIDASVIEVIANGGSKPTVAMMAWAHELELGSWYTLDHNKQITQVQFAWRSGRKHLNLFASVSGRIYLIQAGRLAAYLQAGLLLPQEEETLTVRATRDAMIKLEANPERLLA